MTYLDRTLINPLTFRRDINTIEVIGQASYDAEPDKAIMKIGVVTENEDLNVVQQRNKRIMNNVLKVFWKYNISEENVKTIEYSIRPIYNYIEGKREFAGYEVQHVLEVTINELSDVGRILEEAIGQGANLQWGIAFEVTRFEEYYQMVLKEATINSKEKAIEVANVLGFSIENKPISIKEVKGPQDIVPLRERAMLHNEGVPVHPGIIQIRASVEGVYHLKA